MFQVDVNFFFVSLTIWFQGLLCHEVKMLFYVNTGIARSITDKYHLLYLQ